MIVRRAVLAVWFAGALIASGSATAATASECGHTRILAFESGSGDPIYDVGGDIRARNVGCDRAHKIVRIYLADTAGAGGTVSVRGFECRGGRRSSARYFIDCERAGKRRVFLEGTGGPGC